MIGRFLMGAGLGALVGSGLLAMASVFSPLPAGNGAPAQPSGESSAPKTPAETTASPAAEGTSDSAPEAPAEVTPEPANPAEPASEPQPDEPALEGKAPEAGNAAPETAAAPKVEELPPVPAESAEIAAPKVPEALPAVTTEEMPDAPATPALSPVVSGTDAPEKLAAPGTAEPTPVAPATAEAPAASVSPDLPLAPVTEVAPDEVDPPQAPPLSAEEEAMLAELAKSGTAVLPEGQVDPALPSETPPAAEGDSAALPTPAPAGAEPSVPVEESPKAPEGQAGAEVPEGTDSAEVEVPASDVPEVDTPETVTPEAKAAEVQLDAEPSLPTAEGLPEAADGVTTGRLPKIGDAATSEAITTEAAIPLIEHAAAFENPDAKPAFAIVLVDDGDAGLDRAALAALPFSVTFALDPNHPQAAEHAAIYRAAGREIVMLATGLPEGALASDVEVALSAMEMNLPQSVAVMDLAGQGFQGNRALASLVVPVVGDQGRGLLTWDEGLNAADQVARREDVPSAVVFRDIDGEGETAPVMRRYLDRAVFKAAQEGKVVVVGRTRPETVAAILEWTVEGRGATVALAPLTAVLSLN